MNKGPTPPSMFREPQRGTLPTGINNRGQVVGVYMELNDALLNTLAFVLEDGVFTTIDAPDATVGTLVLDINDGGQLAGVYDRRGPRLHPGPARGLHRL